MSKKEKIAIAKAVRLARGLTIRQVDELDRLVRRLLALGDAIVVGGSELGEFTLPALGEVIYDAADAVRDILDEAANQRVSDIMSS